MILSILTTFIYMFYLNVQIKDKNRHSQKTLRQTVSLYQAQARKICNMLYSSIKAYKAGNYDKAFTTSNSAYWDVYDNILEIKFRPDATPAKIFSVEDQFHDLSAQLKSKKNLVHLKDINKKANKLCKEVTSESNYITENG